MRLEKRLYLEIYSNETSSSGLGDMPANIKQNDVFAFDISGRHNFPIKNEDEPITLCSFEKGKRPLSKKNVIQRAKIEVLAEEHYKDPHYRVTRTRGEYRVISLIFPQL